MSILAFCAPNPERAVPSSAKVEKAAPRPRGAPRPVWKGHLIALRREQRHNGVTTLEETRMFDTLVLVLAVAAIVAPFGVYVHLLRGDGEGTGRRTRGYVILACTLAASAPALVAGMMYSMSAQDWTAGLPWVAWAAGYGAFIAVAGLLARAIGRWLSGPAR